MLSLLALALTLMLADAPVAAVAPAPVDPVIAEVNALLQPFKGKPAADLRGRLGPAMAARAARDGEVNFWELSIEQPTTCGMDLTSGAMRCLRRDPLQCRLAAAFDRQSLLTAWAVTGTAEVCRGFIGKLKAG